MAGNATRPHRRRPGTDRVVAAWRADLVVSLAESHPATRRWRLSLHRARSCRFWPLRQARGAGLVLVRQAHRSPGLADRRPRPSWGDAGDARLGWPDRLTRRHARTTGAREPPGRDGHRGVHRGTADE